MTTVSQTTATFDAKQIERPDPMLFRYYLWTALLTGPFSPIVFTGLWFRYTTLRYKFDDSGVSMSWGVLFKQEVYLTYRRIQDIHLTRNVLQRWMGLAKISLQTASGSSKAEMAIEGVLRAEELRDFLYSRMRGAKNESSQNAAGQNATERDGIGVQHLESGDLVSANESVRATKALEEIRDALRALVEKGIS